MVVRDSDQADILGKWMISVERVKEFLLLGSAHFYIGLYLLELLKYKGMKYLKAMAYIKRILSVEVEGYGQEQN